MKTLIKCAAQLLLLICFSSCTVMGDSIKPSKNFITRNYKAERFNQIDAETIGDISYTQSTNGKTLVQVYGPDNIVNLVQVEVKGNTLILTMKKQHQLKKTKLKITISSPELCALYFKGVGDIHIEDSLNTTLFKVKSKGVGDINIQNLNCEELTICSMGVGDVNVKGKTQTAHLASEGVGDIKAEELQAVNIEAESKGVGDISCYVTTSLKASVNGVGNIRYKGNPSQKSFNKNGIGSIKNI
ncbi:MAG: head GIN domain-containing protein [Bacteroides sp.]